MNKTVLTIFSSIFVLIAGLPSCSPDQKKTSPYRAPIPQIHRVEGALDLKTWDHSNQHELDLEDAIDISEARAVRSEVRLRCQLDDRSYYKESRLSAPREIKVMEIVPENLLTVDLETHSVLCTADLILTNAENSQHIFSFTNFRVRGHSPSEIDLEQNQTVSSQRLWFEFSSVGAARARYRNQAPAKARVHCSSRTFDELTFDRMIDLDDFDFSHPHPFDGLQQNVTELCRVEVRENRRLSALSPLFIFWRRPRLQIAIDQDFSIPEIKQKNFFNSRVVELRKLRLTNAERRTLNFSFPSTLSEAIDVYYSEKVDKRNFGTEFKITGLKDAESRIDRGITSVMIKPGGEVTITLIAHSDYLAARCGASTLLPTGVTMHFDQPQNLTFFEDGIPDQPMPLGDAVAFSFNGRLHPDKPAPLMCAN